MKRLILVLQRLDNEVTKKTVLLVIVAVVLGVAIGIITSRRAAAIRMTVNESFEFLRIVIWPVVALVGIIAVRPVLARLLSGSKVKLSLFGQSIETTLPELGRIIEEQTGGSLLAPEIQYLEEVYHQGLKEYPSAMTSDQQKLVRPLRNYGLVMTIPRNAFLPDATSVQLTPIGRLYMKARTK